MRLRSKEEAIQIISKAAIEYKKNLSNKIVLFITSMGDTLNYFEALFLPQNFKHLTGIRSKHSGADFFNLAVRNRISPNDIVLANDGTTDLKLDVLPQLMNIHITARMVGDFDHSKSILVTDKIAGTVTAAMGFKKTKELYLPNTALKKDVRDVTAKTTRQRVIATFIKHRNENLYKHLTYIAKGVFIDDDILSLIVQEKVDSVGLAADSPIPRRAVE